MKKIILIILFLSGCYLTPDQIKDARIPANVSHYIADNGIAVTYKTDCKDDAWLIGNEATVCLQMGKAEYAYSVEHEVGHHIYEHDFCPKYIGGPCYMTWADRHTIVMEETFAVDYAEAWGQLKQDAKYASYLKSITLDEPMAQEYILHYMGGNYDYILGPQIFPTRIP